MSKINPLSSEEIELLRSFDTPTVCNAIEFFEVRSRADGYMDGRIQANFPEFPPMVGYASTATFRSASSPRGVGVAGGAAQQVALFDEIPAPRVIVFQDLDDPPAAASFGEVMCSVYKTFGCVGIISSGAGRDLEQVRDLEFPAFTGQTICAHGYCHLVELHVPVHVGGITVYPGDLLHGDGNGVTTIPHQIARQVITTCRELMSAEEGVLKTLRTRGPDLEALNKSLATFGRRSRKLTRQMRNLEADSKKK